MSLLVNVITIHLSLPSKKQSVIANHSVNVITFVLGQAAFIVVAKRFQIKVLNKKLRTV
jgi:hypothetical protein